jgi:hypothetical protein
MIETLLTALLTALPVGEGLLLGAGGALTLAGKLVVGGLALGASLGLQMLLAGKPSRSTQPPSDVQSVVKQDVPVRRVHLGRRRVGGPLLFAETANGNLYLIVAFSTGKMALPEWIVDNRPVTLEGGANEGNSASAPYVLEGFGTSRPVLGIYWRSGLSAQTAYDLAGTFPGVWSTDHKLNGIASALLICTGVPQEKFSAIYPNRIPSLNVIASFGEVYDPRTGTTAYSSNLPLMLRHYLTASDGLNISSSLIDDAMFGNAAAAADVLLTTKDGTDYRYHGTLTWALNEEPASVIDRAKLAMDGRLVLTGEGKIGMQAGVWEEPWLTIDDDHIISFEFQHGNGPLASSNTIVLRYEEPLASYAEARSEAWVDQTDVDATSTRTLEIEAFEIQSHNHARRVAKILAYRAAPDWKGTIQTDLFGFQAWDERWIRLQVSDLGIDETFEVMGISLDVATMRVTLQVQSFSSAAYSFDAATEEGDAPALPDLVEEGAVSAPDNVSAVAGSRAVGGGTQYYITLSWDAVVGRVDLTPEAQYSLANQDAWVPMAIASGATSTEAQNLVDGADYDLRVRWKTGSGTAGPWEMVEDVEA